MLVVIDANILFSALIKDAESAKLILSDKLALLAPDKIFDEFKKHKTEILLKTHRIEEEFSEVLSVFEDRIQLVPQDELKPFLNKASLLISDASDREYIASAIKFRCPIWSNDKSFKQQSLVRVFTTKELIGFLSKSP